MSRSSSKVVWRNVKKITLLNACLNAIHHEFDTSPAPKLFQNQYTLYLKQKKPKIILTLAKVEIKLKEDERRIQMNRI
jgi:hypothetical protein